MSIEDQNAAGSCRTADETAPETIEHAMFSRPLDTDTLQTLADLFNQQRTIPVPDVSLPELDESPFERGLPMTIGFKVLITCISFMLFILIVVFAMALLVTADDLTSASAGSSVKTLIIATACAVAVILFMALLFGIYLLVHFFSKKHGEARYCQFFKRRGLLILLIVFIVIALCITMVATCFTEYHKIAAASIFVAALLSMLPITITWHIQDEERLKNFIDGFSKTCSCLAFMGGAAALLVKTFFAG